jgi:hypothetical protein
MKTVYEILAAYCVFTLIGAALLLLSTMWNPSGTDSQPMQSSLSASPITRDQMVYMGYHAEVSKADTGLRR